MGETSPPGGGGGFTDNSLYCKKLLSQGSGEESAESMTEKERPSKSRKDSGLLVWTQKVVDTMKRLYMFTKKSLLKEVEGIKLRRIDDITAILLGAGFIKKGALKKHYTYVGPQGTARLVESFKKNEPIFFAPQQRRSQFYGWCLVQMLASKGVWSDHDLMLMCNDTKARRSYDVRSVFLGANLITMSGKKCFSNIPIPEESIPKSASRLVLTVSDEVAVSILPELKQHLYQNEEIIIFF